MESLKAPSKEHKQKKKIWLSPDVDQTKYEMEIGGTSFFVFV